MGKRSSFERFANDAYGTPAVAVEPLRLHLPKRFLFAEVCAGDGSLIDALTMAGGRCTAAFDVLPRRKDVMMRSALDLRRRDLAKGRPITNPPWRRDTLHALISHLGDLAPSWLLLDANWLFTKQAGPFMCRLRKVVAVGRLKWIPGSPHTGKDDAVWCLFGKPSDEPPQFFGRHWPGGG